MGCRVWRVLEHCWHALAQYEAGPARQRELFVLCDAANETDRRLRTTELAKTHVNHASSLITRREYDAAFESAKKARDLDPSLATAHVAILAVLVRRQAWEEVRHYLDELAAKDPAVLIDPDFRERVVNDPDLIRVSDFFTV